MHIARGIESYSYISSANDGPVLVYRNRGEHYISQYVYLQTQWSCLISVGAVSLMKGKECSIEYVIWALQYQHILQIVMLPSVRMLYPDGIIHFQQDHYSMILVWFKNGYRCRPTSKSLTGHHECLI